MSTTGPANNSGNTDGERWPEGVWAGMLTSAMRGDQEAIEAYLEEMREDGYDAEGLYQAIEGYLEERG